MSIIWSQDLPRLRSIFSKSMCRTQRIVIASVRPATSRTTYVRTAFSLANGAKIRTDTPDHIFYSARVLAFMSGTACLRDNSCS